jgi:hypothetical protein
VTLRTPVLFLWGCLIATAAVAGEEHKMKVEIAVNGDGDGHKVFEWHGDGTSLDDLEVGESKTITDDNGNEITLMRTEDGLEIEVEGEKIELMDFDGDMLHGNHDSEDIMIKGHKTVKVVKAGSADSVTIISSDSIDEETRARIEEALEEGGKEGEVLFIDGSELNGDEQADSKREVRVIRKKIDVTN